VCVCVCVCVCVYIYIYILCVCMCVCVYVQVDMKHTASMLDEHFSNSQHTSLVFVAQANLKGWIPGWAIANAAGTQVMCC
jgi:hypothetical protein